MATATVQTGPYVFASSKSAFHGPDPAKVQEQLFVLNDCYRNLGAAKFSEQFFWILRKNPEKGEKDLLANKTSHWNKRLVPFAHNEIQQHLDQNVVLRNIFLKMRQGGYTTWSIIMRLLLPTMLNPGTGGMLISQNNKYVTLHFMILKRALKYFAVNDPFRDTSPLNQFHRELMANLLHVAASNRREVIFDAIDSRIICESAEVPEAGQGVTVQHVVCDEVARWPGNPEETLANLKEGIPAEGTLDLVSTANGMGGFFFEECMRARKSFLGEETEFKYFFHEWWWHAEYRADKPVDAKVVTPEEELLIQKHKIDLYQLAWRRKKLRELRFEFKEKYPEDDTTCFLLHGTGFFDNEILGQRLLELSDFKPFDEFKKLRIFKPRVKGRRYVIGADVAKGLQVSTDNSDYSYAICLDLETGETMASYMARISPEMYGWDLAEFGRLYNNALIAVERNFEGGTVLMTLEVSCGYTNLYKHKEWWKRERKIVEVLGYPTTAKTRPVALNRARNLLEQSPEMVWDIELVKQALAFIYNEKGKPEGAPGQHDDGVMALSFANFARLVLLGWLTPETVPSEKYGDLDHDENFGGLDDEETQ